MRNLLRNVTDFVTTKKGMWMTLSAWLLLTLLLAVFAPSAREYVVSSVDSLPEDAQSVIAQNKVDEYFEGGDTIPAMLVFQSENELAPEKLMDLFGDITPENVDGLEQVIPLKQLPPQSVRGFFSEDQTTAVLPVSFDASLETEELDAGLSEIKSITSEQTDLSLNVTGPAGIAVDTTELFKRADVVLLLSTVALILVLLIVIYRSPLLALIPLIAAAFVYEVVNQVLGLIGKAGLPLANQSLSIMSILLFASVIDYSLFVFSRYREELKDHESKFTAMREAMREVGIPVFYSGGTVLAAMLVLFFAEFGDYQNFAPLFGTTMFFVMLASVTFVPALFTLFGRKSFWPKIPQVGEQRKRGHSFWGKAGRMVVKKPVISIVAVGAFLVLSAGNLVNLNYEFDTIKSFPEDMPSREGYEILEDKFEKGDLAPTTVLFEAEEEVSKTGQEALADALRNQPLIGEVSINGLSEDGKAVRYQLIFEENPYATETMDALETMRKNSGALTEAAGVEGELFFAGETATKIDDRSINNRDLIVIVTLETILILVMLFFLTRSVKMPLYMMGTILVSFVAALGLGMFLTDILFGIESISNRVPLYSFVFLVALGIDYNIMLISRFLEERRRHPVKKAVTIAVENTGGVISSAGIILAATFAVLMTQPIQILFVFGFIVAIGILLDTFIIRGVLMPALIVLFEKGKKEQTASRAE
ncbi:MMPL family transporter [Virgibacillus sp. MSP4-1]|uniref:MMPL family transporter n=1 Tax=Virgibacillus sp. MSP4-1 TaxID=2700081 RepID=UPI0005C44837|nr:MMPL family transporter [Virgibacillus sp. MSP4-1]QHS24254.1 MMPL family transporter [Virgibacillus sp. MSP4-1]